MATSFSASLCWICTGRTGHEYFKTGHEYSYRRGPEYTYRTVNEYTYRTVNEYTYRYDYSGSLAGSPYLHKVCQDLLNGGGVARERSMFSLQ